MLKKTPLVLLAVAFQSVVIAKPRDSSSAVQISTETYGDSVALLRSLEKAIQKHSSKNRFEVTYGIVEPRGSESGVLVYNKEKALIRIDYSTSFWDNDEHSDFIIEETRTHQWRFSGVTSKRLHLLFARYDNRTLNDHREDAPDPNLSFFPDVVNFGARGGLIGQKFERQREKWVNNRRVRVR